MSNRQRFYSAFARQSMLDALRICEVSSGDTVLLPSFICRDVLAPIHAANARVSFYEVDEKLRPVTTSVVCTPRAILAVNYFGFAQDLGPLQAIAEKSGATIIEDNAHGLFSRDEAGVALGERTGLGFTSFRKTLRVVNGAFLSVDLTRFPDALSVIGNIESPAVDALPLSFQARHAVSSLERVTGLRLMSLSRSAVRRARQIGGRPTLPRTSESETVMPQPRSVHATALRQLEQTNEQDESRRRRELYHRVATRLQDAGFRLVFEELGSGTVPWSVPYFASQDQSTLARRALREFGLDTFPWPDLPAAARETCPEFYLRVNVVSMMQ